MIVNDKEVNINEILENIDFQSNMLKKVNDKLDLTRYQIEVLKRFDIDIESMYSLSNIIYEAELAYEETLDEELEVVLDELSERNYYENTKK